MRSQEIARRYATALYEVAVENAAVNETENELANIVEVASGETEAHRFLAHPLVPREKKSHFLAAAFPETTSRMNNFLELLIRNRRETYLDLIYHEFVRIKTAAAGMIQVAVITAQPLSDQDKRRLTNRLEKALKKPVQLDEHVEDSLLGGIRIEAAGHVMDGTIRARLEELRKKLEE